mmetsp:Transcript_17708/g.37003  ORF Transcript_17708/g.37003 Transcript_17708/m.37003 type:complete len:127 (-) Transcript_17708:1120-1500(-)
MKTFLFLLPFLPLIHAFTPHRSNHAISKVAPSHRRQLTTPLTTASPSSCLDMIDRKRREELGLPDDADEYDLGVALATNTDDGISKIVAGSFIAVMLILLVVGLVIPSITDYGDGVCSPIQNGGRC